MTPDTLNLPQRTVALSRAGDRLTFDRYNGSWRVAAYLDGGKRRVTSSRRKLVDAIRLALNDTVYHADTVEWYVRAMPWGADLPE